MGTVNVVFLIGNGFDRNLGLATSYQEFYDYYLKQNSESEIVKKLKQSIKMDRDTWSDLERSLGEFTNEIRNQQELDAAIIDLVRHLRDYLSKLENDIDYSVFDPRILLEEFGDPERVMSERDRRELKEFRTKFKGNQQILIHVLSFNYTKVIESILGGKHKNIEINKNSNRTVTLSNVEHIHGYVDQRLILGLNDTSQIANREFSESRDAVELLVKPRHNQQLGHLRDEYCEQQIQKASMIYIFGSSIGETDKKWWEAIGNRLGNNCCLVIFYRGTLTTENIEILEARQGREVIENFLTMTSLDESQKEKVRDYIYAAKTKDLFNLSRST